MTPDPRILILASGEGNAAELGRLFNKLPGGHVLDLRTGRPEALLTDTATLAATVLLVLDLDMAPGYRPLDLLYRMRAIPAARRLPVLAVTTAKNDLFRNMAFALGVEEFFALPAEGQLVLAAAERLIRDYSLTGTASAANRELSHRELSHRELSHRELSRIREAEARLAEKDKEIEQLVRVRDSIFELSRQELLEARADAERSVNEKIAALKEKSELQMAFGKYISPDVLNQLIKSDGLHTLSGEKKDVSVLFADLRGFTSLAEELDAADTVSLLNDFFSELTQIIITHTGFIDKYIGDCIMAIFGAPAPLTQHHHLALLAAVKMQDRFRALRPAWEKRYGRAVGMGIGINCGEAVVGTIGSFQKLSYTAIGDTVNVASRLEDISRDGEILFGQRIRDRVRESFLTRHGLRITERGETTIKGKSGSFPVYNIGRIPEPS